MDYVWNMEYLKSASRLHAFIPRVSSKPLGMGLPRTSWVKLNRLRTGVGRLHSSNHTTTTTTRWENRINCLRPLRYNLKEVLMALEELQAYCVERKDRKTVSETKSLIAQLSKWSFILSVISWYGILFQVSITSKILQSYGVSLVTMENEIKRTEIFLQNYRERGFASAATYAVEIAQELDIDTVFFQTRSEKKKRLFNYEAEDVEQVTSEERFKVTFLGNWWIGLLCPCKNVLS